MCVCMCVCLCIYPVAANKVSLMWSEPHFYNADPHYGNAVRGLKPNKTLHESTVIVEPVSVHK